MLEMRNVLNTKLNKKGFTLAELLVVVAIIAILVAVSIPIFTGKLNQAKESTDLANERAAKAVAVTAYLSDELTAGTTYYYDAKKGTIETATTSIKVYGKSKAHKDGIVTVVIKETGNADDKKPTVDIDWTVNDTK